MASKFPHHYCAVLVGPTAGGKTDLIRSLARRVPLEVINCDSMQIYKDMPILSQTPPRDDLESIPYHLQQALSPTREFNAAQFSKRASRLIHAIQKRGRLPLVAGGTGLYLMALLDGLFDGPAEDAFLRQRLYAKAEKKGSQELYGELMARDPEAAKKIHPHDVRRIVRALEVVLVTGNKFSRLQKERRGIWGTMEIRVWGTLWPREELYQRIERRVLRMFRQHLVEEASRLLKRRLSKTAQGCLGLKEVRQYVDGEISLEAAKAQLLMNTRRFAKRQMTWFRRDKRIQWIPMGGDMTPSQAAGHIAREINAWKKRSS